MPFFVSRTTICPLCKSRLMMRHAGPLYLTVTDVGTVPIDNAKMKEEHDVDMELIDKGDVNEKTDGEIKI